MMTGTGYAEANSRLAASMSEGVIAEAGPTERIFADAAHDYTRLLLAAASRREDFAELAAQRI